MILTLAAADRGGGLVQAAGAVRLQLPGALLPAAGRILEGSHRWIRRGFHHDFSHLCRGGAANFGFISITYHQYIFGLYKYILRLEISIFDRENNKNRQELRIIICFRDIQSGRGTTINVGY